MFWRRSIRISRKVDAVAREPSAEEMSVERCLGVGGEKVSWLVTRKRNSFVGFESNAALLCEALSLIIPIISSFSSQ